MLRQVIDHDAVPALALGSIERLVGAIKQIDKGFRRWCKPGDAKTGGDQSLIPGDGREGFAFKRTGDKCTQPFRRIYRSQQASLGQQDGKLLPAISSGNVDFSDVRTEQLANFSQDIISSFVAVNFVYGVEMIHIDHDHRKIALKAACSLKFALAELEQVPAIE